jgi:hypothetical protein
LFVIPQQSGGICCCLLLPSSCFALFFGCHPSPQAEDLLLLLLLLLFAVAFAFLVVIPQEPALSEVEWGICFCRCLCF